MQFLMLVPWWGWLLAIVLTVCLWRLLRRDRPTLCPSFYGHVDALQALLVQVVEWKEKAVVRPARGRRAASKQTVQVLEADRLTVTYEGSGSLESLVIVWRDTEVTLSFYAGELTSVVMNDQAHDDTSSLVRNGRGRAVRALSAVRESLGLDGYGANNYEQALKEKKHRADEHRADIHARLYRGKKRE